MGYKEGGFYSTSSFMCFIYISRMVKRKQLDTDILQSTQDVHIKENVLSLKSVHCVTLCLSRSLSVSVCVVHQTLSTEWLERLIDSVNRAVKGKANSTELGEHAQHWWRTLSWVSPAPSLPPCLPPSLPPSISQATNTWAPCCVQRRGGPSPSITEDILTRPSPVIRL
jgi:hypothetical protein